MLCCTVCCVFCSAVCFALLCHARRCCAMPCYAVLYCVLQCSAVLCVLCVLQCRVFSSAIPCFAVLCFVCFTVLCVYYALVYYALLNCVLFVLQCCTVYSALLCSTVNCVFFRPLCLMPLLCYAVLCCNVHCVFYGALQSSAVFCVFCSSVCFPLLCPGQRQLNCTTCTPHLNKCSKWKLKHYEMLDWISLLLLIDHELWKAQQFKIWSYWYSWKSSAGRSVEIGCQTQVLAIMIV